MMTTGDNKIQVVKTKGGGTGKPDSFHAVAVLLLIVSVSVMCGRPENKQSVVAWTDSVPSFRVDPFWPKPLPNQWLIGQVAGVAADSKNYIWIVHRPNSLGDDEYAPSEKPASGVPYVPAPPVIEFDADGEVVRAWGGPGDGFDWPENPHGIFIDHEDHVWIGGSGPNDHQVLKFNRDGIFLLQIGMAGQTGGSNDTNLLGRPADIDVDPITNEVYIADGYLNHRVIVFDAHTGKYLRHWGAYGRRPDDAPRDPYKPGMPPPAQFANPVHAVRIAGDGLVYVCDRRNDRIQVFQKNGQFVKEGFIARETLGNGTAWDIDFSPDPRQSYIYLSDGTNQCVWVLHREHLKVAGHFGRIGRYAGQFIWVHSIAVDATGNIFTGEVYKGKRVQKFKPAPPENVY
jgi:DNA-binding beta-propeller fold protein YncE